MGKPAEGREGGPPNGAQRGVVQDELEGAGGPERLGGAPGRARLGDLPGEPSEGAVARLRFEPMGLEVVVPPGRRVYDVATALGLPLAQSCGGEGICGRCGVRVVRGGSALSPERGPERARKVANRVDPELRLACLTTVRGPVVVTTDYW